MRCFYRRRENVNTCVGGEFEFEFCFVCSTDLFQTSSFCFLSFIKGSYNVQCRRSNTKDFFMLALFVVFPVLTERTNSKCCASARFFKCWVFECPQLKTLLKETKGEREVRAV